jgi:predicted nucleic acid-binding protein
MKDRIVIDTNIYAAMLPSKYSVESTRQANESAIAYSDEKFIPVITATTYRELERIFLRPAYDPWVKRSQRRGYLDQLYADADYQRIDPEAPKPTCADPDDVPFLEAARQLDKTLIVNPTQFLLLENQGQRLGLTEPTKVVATTQPDLLRQGHMGSTVFLTRDQAKLVKGHEIEEVPAIPIYSPHKGRDPEGYLLVTDNKDLLAREAFTASDKLGVTVLSTRQYAQLQNVFSTDPVAFADQVKPTSQQPTMKAVQTFIAGQRLRHGG